LFKGSKLGISARVAEQYEHVLRVIKKLGWTTSVNGISIISEVGGHSENGPRPSWWWKEGGMADGRSDNADGSSGSSDSTGNGDNPTPKPPIGWWVAEAVRAADACFAFRRQEAVQREQKRQKKEAKLLRDFGGPWPYWSYFSSLPDGPDGTKRKWRHKKAPSLSLNDGDYYMPPTTTKRWSKMGSDDEGVIIFSAKTLRMIFRMLVDREDARGDVVHDHARTELDFMEIVTSGSWKRAVHAKPLMQGQQQEEQQEQEQEGAGAEVGSSRRQQRQNTAAEGEEDGDDDADKEEDSAGGGCGGGACGGAGGDDDDGVDGDGGDDDDDGDDGGGCGDDSDSTSGSSSKSNSNSNNNNNSEGSVPRGVSLLEELQLYHFGGTVNAVGEPQSKPRARKRVLRGDRARKRRISDYNDLGRWVVGRTVDRQGRL
jgi:hypothetical protein